MNVPIKTAHLFPVLDKALIDLLRSLSPEEWTKRTRAKLWSVKDIASHLLDGNIRTLSMSRDHHFAEKPSTINSYKDLVNYLNELNADWVKATRRLSPEVLISLLEITGIQYCEHIKTLDPFAPAIFSVAWAGEETSLNWFHIAREYTEKWHHQQQIREAVGKPGISSQELYYPVLDTFMRALPHAYRNTTAKDESAVKVSIIGETAGDWYVKRINDAWRLDSQVLTVTTHITIDQDVAWKLFTRAFPAQKHII